MFVSECVCCFIFVITIKYSDPINFKVCVWGGEYYIWLTVSEGTQSSMVRNAQQEECVAKPSHCTSSEGKQRVNRRGGQAKQSQSPPPAIHFLQQGSIS